ncbi:MAG: aminotransferase class I/II-fold pyridoxal phosphate-dependent enzyme, partial [Vulcanimicrobiaceae bacterium]
MLATATDRISSAVARLGAENAFMVLARARVLEAQGRRIVHMEVGEPEFDTPTHIKDAAIAALHENHTHYSPSTGINELRDVIADYVSRFRGITPAFTRDNVTVAPGAKPVSWNNMSAIIN